jgi:hypothetical protein
MRVVIGTVHGIDLLEKARCSLLRNGERYHASLFHARNKLSDVHAAPVLVVRILVPADRKVFKQRKHLGSNLRFRV